MRLPRNPKILMTLAVVGAIIFIFFVWFGAVGYKTDKHGLTLPLTVNSKILLTIIAVVAVVSVDLNIHRQRRKDAQVAAGNYSNSATDNYIETNYKIQGWYWRLRAIGHIISAVVVAIIGIYFVFSYIANNQMGGMAVFLLIGIICFFAGISWAIGAYFYLWRSK